MPCHNLDYWLCRSKTRQYVLQSARQEASTILHQGTLVLPHRMYATLLNQQHLKPPKLILWRYQHVAACLADQQFLHDWFLTTKGYLYPIAAAPSAPCSQGVESSPARLCLSISNWPMTDSLPCTLSAVPCSRTVASPRPSLSPSAGSQSCQHQCCSCHLPRSTALQDSSSHSMNHHQETLLMQAT